MQLEYDIMKKLLAEQRNTNELLQTLINIQQPVQEVVSNIPSKPNTRGPRDGNQKQ